jgi:tight adherence protein C
MGYVILIPILVAVAVFGLVLALFSGIGAEADNQNHRMDEIKQTDDERENEPKEKVKFSQNIKNKLEENNKKRERNKRKKIQKNKKRNVVEDMLTMVQINMTSEEFSVVKLIVACILMFLAFIFCKFLRLDTTYLLIALLITGLLGMILPSEWLKKKVARYQESIRLELPEIMDLLVVSVEAGLGFDAALSRLYEKNKSILMEELMQATRDIQRGVSKKEAYGDLSKRCKVKELTSFLTAMVQADQMGSSIKSVLRAQSEMLRVARGRRAAKKAKEAPIKMLIPMVLLIFPVIFIILLGPAILNIMDIIG